MIEKKVFLVTVQFVGQALGVSSWQVVHNSNKWGLTTHWSVNGGHRRFDLEEVKALARKWADEAEEEAEQRRSVMK